MIASRILASVGAAVVPVLKKLRQECHADGPRRVPGCRRRRDSNTEISEDRSNVGRGHLQPLSTRSRNLFGIMDRRNTGHCQMPVARPAGQDRFLKSVKEEGREQDDRPSIEQKVLWVIVRW